MSKNNISNDLYDKAKRRVKIKRDFKEHRNVYIMCIGGLVLLDLFLGHGIDFAHYVAAAWGIGLGCHWADTVNSLKKLDEDKEIQRELEGMLKRQLGDKYHGEPFELNLNDTNTEKDVIKKD